MYRRPSSNVVTPKYNIQRQSRLTAVATTAGKLRRSTSANSLARPSTAARGPRTSSVSRASVASGRPSNPYAGKTITKDPRLISDKQYQAHMIHQMLEFLTTYNYSGTPLAEKQLRSPSRQDFVSLLTFLYRFIDENYDYKGQPLELELPALFKPLGYPLLPNASMLKTFNASQYWPAVLAAVSWLREIVTYGLSFDFGRTMFPASERDYEVVPNQNGGETLAFTIYQYHCHCFVKSQSDEDGGFDEFEQMLVDALDPDGAAVDLDNLNSENERLKEELHMLESKLEEPNTIRVSINEKTRNLENLQEFMKKCGDYLRVTERTHEDLMQKQAVADEEIKNLRDDIENKKAAINKQGIKPADVQLMFTKRADLVKRIEAYQAEKQELEKARWDMEKAMAEMKKPIDLKAAEFGKVSKALLRSMPALRKLKGDLDIAPFTPNFLDSVRDFIWPWINGVKKIVLDEVESAGTNIADMQSQIANLRNQIADLEWDFDALETKIKQRDADIQTLQEKKNIEYQRLREEMTSLEIEYGNAVRQKGMTRAAKEKQLAEWKREYDEKKKANEAEIEKMDKILQRAVQMSNDHMDYVARIRNEVADRVQVVKKDVMHHGK